MFGLRRSPPVPRRVAGLAVGGQGQGQECPPGRGLDSGRTDTDQTKPTDSRAPASCAAPSCSAPATQTSRRVDPTPTSSSKDNEQEQ